MSKPRTAETCLSWSLSELDAGLAVSLVAVAANSLNFINQCFQSIEEITEEKLEEEVDDAGDKAEEEDG